MQGTYLNGRDFFPGIHKALGFVLNMSKITTIIEPDLHLLGPHLLELKEPGNVYFYK